ncbi:MAG: DUF4157 domain-containing protein [Candidatus Competibacteraceae bacterium]
MNQQTCKHDKAQPENERSHRSSTGATHSPTAVPAYIGLHRRLGNAAMQRYLQAKLAVSRPDDIYEQEADRVADQVMRMPGPTSVADGSPPPRVQRACPSCEEDLQRQVPKEEEELLQTKPVVADAVLQRKTPLEEEELQRKTPLEEEELQRKTPLEEEELQRKTPLEEEELQRKAPLEEEELQRRANKADDTAVVNSKLEDSIHALAGRGNPLPDSVRTFMEPRFGADFSGVRLHTDAHAGELARAVNAQAFTSGRDIFFAAGKWSPTTDRGRWLLAHELTHVVQQTSSLRTQEPSASLTVICRGEPALARTPETAAIPAMTPEDMWKKIIAARGFEETIPVHQLEATKARLEAMEAQLKKNPSPSLQRDYRKLLNRYNLSKLDGPGGTAGLGFNTFALIQVVDQDGNIVATAMGKYTGADHAEEIAVTQLRRQLAGQKVAGGRIDVTGDKEVCSKRCAPVLTQFAKDIEVDKVEGHVFTREKVVGEGEATEKTTARTASKASSEGKPLTLRSEVVYARPGSGPVPARPSAQGAGTPAKVPAGGGTAAKLPARISAPAEPAPPPREPAIPKAEPLAPRPKGRATLSGGKVRISSGGIWSVVGKVGTGASVALTVWGAISTIDGALAQLEKAQSGSIAPQVAAAIEAVEKYFPTADALRADVLWYWRDREKDYSRATAWLQENGMRALILKGADLDRMGYELNSVLRYSEDYQQLRDELIQQSNNIAPLLAELKKRIGVLNDIVNDLETVMPYYPSDTAQSMILGIRQAFWDAAQDLVSLEDPISIRKGTYDRDYADAQQKRRTAAEIFNFWAPAFAKIWKEQTGKTAAPTSLPVD